MNLVFRHIPFSLDEYMGQVNADGKVFEDRLGPDRLVGRVDLSDGRIFESRLGPDKLTGRVDPENGRVYHTRLGPDEYLGQVRSNGQCYLHRRMSRDIYLGKIRDMSSRMHGGAALLLLLLPAAEDMEQEKNPAEPFTGAGCGGNAPRLTSLRLDG